MLVDTNRRSEHTVPPMALVPGLSRLSLVLAAGQKRASTAMGFGAKKKRLSEEEQATEAKRARLEELASLPLEQLNRSVGEKDMDLCSKHANNEEETDRFKEIVVEAEELREAIELKKARLRDEEPQAAPLAGQALADQLSDMTDEQIREQIRERKAVEDRAIQSKDSNHSDYVQRSEAMNMLRAEIFGRSKEGQRLAAERKELAEEKARNARRKAALDDPVNPSQHLNATDKKWWADNGQRQWSKHQAKVKNARVEKIAERMARVAVEPDRYVPAPLELPSGKLPPGDFGKALNDLLEASDLQAVESMRNAHKAEQLRLGPARMEYLATESAEKKQATAATAKKQAARRKSLQAGLADRKVDPRNRLDQK
jgi:hypothetical protein